MEPEPGLAPAPMDDDDVLDVDAALREASAARCGLAARCNVPTRLGASEVAVIRASRAAGVCTLNEFRARCGLPRWTSFEEMTGGETKLCETLAELYGDVDEVELYTGMLCEYNVSNTGAMLPHRARVRVTARRRRERRVVLGGETRRRGTRTPRGESNTGRRPVSPASSPRTRARNSWGTVRSRWARSPREKSEEDTNAWSGSTRAVRSALTGDVSQPARLRTKMILPYYCSRDAGLSKTSRVSRR